MATTYRNFLSGVVDDSPLLIGATTLNSTALANMPAVAAPNTMWLVLDPNGTAGAPEIVQVTAHTAAATSCTIVRGQQTSTGGGAARQHLQNTVWVVAATVSDLDELPFRKLTTTGDMLYASAANTASRLAVGTAGLVLESNGSTPQWGQVDTAGIADDAVTLAKITDAVFSTSATASTLAQRDASGRVAVATPVGVSDATPKAYVDALDTAMDARVDTLEAKVAGRSGAFTTTFGPTTSSVFVSTGVSVAVTTGTLVSVTITAAQTAGLDTAIISYGISGATFQVPSDQQSTDLPAGSLNGRSGSATFLSSPSAGSNTFTVWAKSTSGANPFTLGYVTIIVERLN